MAVKKSAWKTVIFRALSRPCLCSFYPPGLRQHALKASFAQSTAELGTFVLCLGHPALCPGWSRVAGRLVPIPIPVLAGLWMLSAGTVLSFDSYQPLAHHGCPHQLCCSSGRDWLIRCLITMWSLKMEPLPARKYN